MAGVTPMSGSGLRKQCQFRPTSRKSGCLRHTASAAVGAKSGVKRASSWPSVLRHGANSPCARRHMSLVSVSALEVTDISTEAARFQAAHGILPFRLYREHGARGIGIG